MAQTSQTTSPVPTRTTAAVTAIADPAPLGLAGFALTTLVLSVYNAGLIKTGSGTVLGLALAYGGIAQLAAGMWEFVKGNTFGATAFASYGAFWLSFWYFVNHLPADTAGNDLAHGIGVYLLAWGIFTFYMFIASTRVSGAVAAVFILLAATFIVLAIGAFTMNTADIAAASYNTVYKVGGWLGLATAAVAWYASFAGVTNFTYKRTVVPTFPRE